MCMYVCRCVCVCKSVHVCMFVCMRARKSLNLVKPVMSFMWDHV